MDEIRLRLIDALPSLESAEDAMRECIEAVSDATGASVGVWYVDEERDSVDVRLRPAPRTATLRDTEGDPRAQVESEGLVRDAWRKGALVWSTTGSSDGAPRFAIPLTHEAGTSAVLVCTFEEGAEEEARLTADFVEAVAPALGPFVATVRDISESKRVEKELEGALSLERSASDRLRAVDQMRRTMLHAFAHEIVDPLSVVRGLSVWLSDHAEDRGRHAREDRELAVSHLVMAAERMSRLLDSLLDLERLDLGTVVPIRRQTDIARIVSDVAGEMHGMLTERPVLDLEHVVVAADPVLVDTIVRNLLRNAATHSPEGSPITVRTRKHRGGVLLSVEDRGPGVPPRQRRMIFQPFHRGPNAPGDGLGIGLSLVARLSSMHGGRAWVDQAGEGGAAFHVWLPDRARIENPVHRG